MLIAYLLILLLTLFLLLKTLKNYNKFNSYIKGKDIIVCGNSPEFEELFKKIKLTDNSVIVRFNNAIKYYTPTDIYVYNKVMYNHNKSIPLRIKKYKFVFGGKNSDFRNNGILEGFDFKQHIPTTGMRFLTWLCTKRQLVNSITIIGFNMKSKTGHIFDNKKISKKHNGDIETKYLKELVKKYNIKYIK